MTCNIKLVDGVEHNYPNASAAFYSEVTDTFTVHVNAIPIPVFEIKMGDIAELEIYG